MGPNQPGWCVPPSPPPRPATRAAQPRWMGKAPNEPRVPSGASLGACPICTSWGLGGCTSLGGWAPVGPLVWLGH